MPEAVTIRILEKDSNRRGDLFGRLMADLFIALGYDQPRLNVHKSGRELDLDAVHRLEPRKAIGECKATAEPIGGDDVNKFVGTLDAEHDDKVLATGYFISLSGFKETALEQERHRRRTKIILLNGQQVVDELVKGRILVPKERAADLAGRCCSELAHIVLDPESELLAHQRGWIWAVYYTRGKARTHFALIHSDGTALARALADEVVAADRESGGQLHTLNCLNPAPASGADTDPNVAEALAAYRKYLENECGYIQLDGLPADTEVGSRRLRLENLFVPLHLDVGEQKKEKRKERQPVGTVLSEHSRLALLAAPGGGKSTLIKRLAVAYADPARREQIADDLPKRDWLPLFFRCRELRGLARGSFDELLEALSQREPVRQFAATFRGYVDRALLAGRVMFLVDGLDEISDSGDRAAFVCTIRSALQAYPNTAIVITSREAGFRHVAAHLAPVCTQATLSPFGPDDICRLSVAWHTEVLGDTEKVREDAEQLAASIVQNDRIQRLAVNPLLLTTLLLVRRWVGSLPTRRAVLYGKAVELLLMTWNTEGHEPIPEEEALPQLCYVASAMMLSSVQKISRPRLASLLQQARAALPTELGYVKGTVDEFIQRVEDRSSLLMMTGHDVEDAQLVEFFEFRHLTFQEFLTARAMVEGWHPDREETDTLASVLEPHFNQEEWREVIPLAAVLGGKATEALIQRLAHEIRQQDAPQGITSVLASCMADEAAARPGTVRAALRGLARQHALYEYIETIARGRYGGDFRDEVEKLVLAEGPLTGKPGSWLAAIIFHQAVDKSLTTLSSAATQLEEMLKSPERLARLEGILGSMHLCWFLQHTANRPALTQLADAIRRIAATAAQMLFADDPWERYVACWLLAWVASCRVWQPPREPDILSQFYKLWRGSRVYPDGRRFAAWALGAQPIEPREGASRLASIPRADVSEMVRNYDDLKEVEERLAILVCAWYLRALSDKELVERIKPLVSQGAHTGDPLKLTLRELLQHLGEKLAEEPRKENPD
jgi:hypothetical protein